MKAIELVDRHLPLLETCSLLGIGQDRVPSDRETTISCADRPVVSMSLSGRRKSRPRASEALTSCNGVVRQLVVVSLVADGAKQTPANASADPPISPRREPRGPCCALRPKRQPEPEPALSGANSRAPPQQAVTAQNHNRRDKLPSSFIRHLKSYRDSVYRAYPNLSAQP